MALIESLEREQGGKLVAFEGDVDIIATQLRLLPPSQKILVLPSLLDDLLHDVEPFNARAFIRNAHTAFTERTERARSFLKSSTTAQPRLVFTNGGSVRARTVCITKICENVTNGDFREAETIFNEIVKDGVVGLMKVEDITEEETQTDGSTEKGDVNEDVQSTPDTVEDPSSKAMKAADSLDRETAELQEDPTAEAKDSSADAIAETGAGATNIDHTFKPEARDNIVTTVVTVPSKTQRLEKKATIGSGYSSRPTTPITSNTASVRLSQQTEGDNEYDDDDDNEPDAISPSDDPFFSAPPTPAVVYGEARVVTLQTTPTKTTRRVKSVDELLPSSSGSATWGSTPRALRQSKSAYHLGRPGSSDGRMQKDQSHDGFQTLPRSTFMKASTTTIKKPSICESTSSSIATPKALVYADRGTDAEDILSEADAEENAPFEPVFPVVEDLVIHFTQDQPHEIFEYVLSTYKTGNYPVLPSLETESVAASPTATVEEDRKARPTSHLTAETDDEGFQRRHEFDPYAANNYPGGVNQWPTKPKQDARSEQNLKPPSPSPTPPPSSKDVPEKFCEFSPTNPHSVIGIQNSLRSLLNLHFPAGENGYSQYCFPVSFETERLWKPVFRNDETPSIGNEGTTVDQIIAFGCEEGVKKEFFTQLSGQIEKLGTKRDGMNKSARIDLRYFISNVMQTHFNPPSNIPNTLNPLSSPEILAAYLVPQIEAYLAINTSIRLLILHYSFDHLATMIELRKIVSQDILKIAGIMDSTSSDPPPVSRTPKANPLSNEATAKPHRLVHSRSQESSQRKASITSKKSESGISFSKANYLLPSVSTDAEIAAFLSGIWTNLMEISVFYTPEPEPKPIIIEKPPLPPTPAVSSFNTRDNTYPPISYRQNSTRESKINRLTGSTPPHTPTERKGHKYAASVASTTRTTASERYRREEVRVEKEWENFYIGEEDSEDDDYDRMVMGRAMARIVPEVKVITSDGKTPKRSTKKALKWLGLA